MNVLCAIPARAGSVRVSGKNLRVLAGRPLIEHTIAAARAAALGPVVVCTEDETIAAVARDAGAEVPCCVPPALAAGDRAAHEPCLFVCDHLAAAGREFDALICLQPTSPLRSVEDIQAGWRRFVEGEYDFLVSVTAIDPHYFHWAVQADAAGRWAMVFGDRYMAERSELPVVHRPNGAIKIARIARLRDVGHFFGPRLGVVDMPPERAVHIGEEFDWQVCAYLMEQAHA